MLWTFRRDVITTKRRQAENQEGFLGRVALGLRPVAMGREGLPSGGHWNKGPGVGAQSRRCAQTSGSRGHTRKSGGDKRRVGWGQMTEKEL